MAMSFIAKPYSFFPAYNQMRFIVDSTNKNNTAFEYIVQVFPAGSSTEIAKYSIKPRFSDGYGEQDLSELLSTKVTSEILNAGATSYFGATNSFYKYDVKVGERYIVSVPYTSSLTNYGGFVRVNVSHSYSIGDQIYIAQSDGGTANPQVEGYQTITAVGVGYFDINVLWSTVTDATINGSIKYADNRRTETLNVISSLNNMVFNGVFDSIGINTYTHNTYDLNSVNDLPLTVLPETGYMIAKSAPLLINFKASSGAIRFENSDGDVFELSLIGSDITMVNCGTFNTPSLTIISGTSPLVKPTTTHYDFYYYDGSQKSRKTRVNINQSCEIEPFSILFVDQLGSLISLPFTLKAKESQDIKKETFNKDLTGVVTGGVWQNKIIEGVITEVNQTKTLKMELNSPYVSDEMSELYYQMHSAPVRLLFDGANFIPITLDNTNIMMQTHKVDRKCRYTINITMSNNERING